MNGRILDGGMPGDVVQIDDSHRERASVIFPLAMQALAERTSADRLVISVYGGSGVGKSEIGRLLAQSFTGSGLNVLLISGDNYPHRIPAENDAERKVRFEGSKRQGLEEYLGTEDEIDFSLINELINNFREGQSPVRIKKMGRSSDDVSFRELDISDVGVMIIEWTHGNNPLLRGVDFPVYLYSSPQETLEHRKKRARDNEVDSPFTQLVLEIEQTMLLNQVSSAALIVGRDGTVMTPGEILTRGEVAGEVPDEVPEETQKGAEEEKQDE